MTRTVVTLVVLVVLAAACHHDPAPTTPTVPTFVDTPPPPAISCEDALVEVVKLASEPHNANAFGEIFVRHCNAESWSADARACFKRQPAADVQQCVELLSNYQRQELGQELKTLAGD
ncbi:MAG: hypothetical protein H0T79_21595 [Deltaproteobacteria bacterium]|nr:hypothetical protein [Deltaproteobacteria bacterium]